MSIYEKNPRGYGIYHLLKHNGMSQIEDIRLICMWGSPLLLNHFAHRVVGQCIAVTCLAYR